MKSVHYIHYESSVFFIISNRFIMPRTYDEELKFIERINSNSWRIKKGFVPNMNVCREIKSIKNEFEFIIG